MKKFLFVLGLMACSMVAASAQDGEPISAPETRPYSFTGIIGGGYVRNLTEFEDTQNDLDVNRNQFSVYGRFLWRPGNLLSGGLEFGYMNFYSVSNDRGGKAVRSAIPLYLVFSMTLWDRVDLGIGYGVGLLSSTISGQAGDPVSSSTVSSSYLLSAGYHHPLNEQLSLGGEVRYSNFDKLDDQTLSVNVVLSYLLFEY